MRERCRDCVHADFTRVAIVEGVYYDTYSRHCKAINAQVERSGNVTGSESLVQEVHHIQGDDTDRGDKCVTEEFKPKTNIESSKDQPFTTKSKRRGAGGVIGG